MKKEKREQVVKEEHERRFLLPNIPSEIFFGIQNRAFRTEEIEQGYGPNNGGRFRKTTYKDGSVSFSFTVKEKIPNSQRLSRKEVITLISKEEYEKYLEEMEGELIQKTRYFVPIGDLVLEINMFHGRLEGGLLGEVEFATVQEAEAFEKPDWIGRDVTHEISNRALSLGANIPQD